MTNKHIPTGFTPSGYRLSHNITITSKCNLRPRDPKLVLPKGVYQFALPETLKDNLLIVAMSLLTLAVNGPFGILCSPVRELPAQVICDSSASAVAPRETKAQKNTVFVAAVSAAWKSSAWNFLTCTQNCSGNPFKIPVDKEQPEKE